MKACAADMYKHAKLARVGDLRKKLHGLIAKGDLEGDEPMEHGDIMAAAEHAAPGMHAPEGSPEEEAAESPMQEAQEGPDHDEDDLTKMKKAYFKPGAKPKRPGTAAMIAARGSLPTLSGKGMSGKPFGKGRV